MSYLLRDGHVLTMDAARRVFPSGFVLTDGAGRIAAVGPMAECPDAPGAEPVDCSGRIVVPGLIDALHLHWTHLFPGERPASSAAAHLDRPAHELAARLAAAALPAGGVTSALLEMPATMAAGEVRAVAEIFRDAGVGAVPAVAPGLAEAVEGAAVTLTADVIALARGEASEATIRAAAAAARRLGRRILLRIEPEGATPEAMAAATRTSGRSTVLHLMEMGLLDDRCLVVCPRALDDPDRALVLESGCFVIGLPVADAFAGRGSALFSALARAGVPCALGSGGPGAGATADMVEQMKAVVMTQNATMLDPAAMSLERALEMATVGAAEALGLAAETGALAAGKRADIAVYDVRNPHQQVAAKPLSAFIACTRATEAEVVLAGGARVAAAAPGIAAARAARGAARAAIAAAGARP